jgi:hypothetical protein
MLRAAADRGDPAGRKRLLDSPLLGGWIQDVLFWIEVESLASSPGARHRGTGAQARLFDLIARTEHLVEAVPAGRPDSRFAARARSRARTTLRERMADLPRILFPRWSSGGSSRSISIPFRENSDEGCPADRIRLGETPLVLGWPRGITPRTLRISLRRGALRIPPPAELLRHETIPGTSILIGHRLISTADRMRVGPAVPGLGRRLERALSLIDEAWPRAAAEIRRRTWLVVPLVEPGTVSYSMIARPGISYLNVFRGSLVDLADDLLHETAHHRLHARQEVRRYLDDDSEPYAYSPWRRALRPLNGILHGTFTFLFRAELFLRLGGRRGSLTESQRRRVRSEARRELEFCGRTLGDLTQAGREGLLTPAGRELVSRMARRRARLLRGGLSPGAPSSIL